jgi:tetratricopeptide (TPR) repeat protein
VGAALLAVSFVAIAVALVPAARREGATGTVAQAAVVGLTGWLAHAQLDWLWEMPAAAALALAVAGLGVGATSSGQVAPAPPSFGLPLVRGTAALAAAVVAVMAASLWLAVRYEERGVTLWRSAPSIADADLRRATRLDPLGSDALLIRGSIAARRGRWVEMRDAFTAAVARDGSDWYAALELAVAEAHLGNRPTALASARQAVRLNPRAAAARAALTDLRLGRIPSQPALDRALAAAST